MVPVTIGASNTTAPANADGKATRDSNGTTPPDEWPTITIGSPMTSLEGLDVVDLLRDGTGRGARKVQSVLATHDSHYPEMPGESPQQLFPTTFHRRDLDGSQE